MFKIFWESLIIKIEKKNHKMIKLGILLGKDRVYKFFYVVKVFKILDCVKYYK